MSKSNIARQLAQVQRGPCMQGLTWHPVSSHLFVSRSMEAFFGSQSQHRLFKEAARNLNKM